MAASQPVLHEQKPYPGMVAKLGHQAAVDGGRHAAAGLGAVAAVAEPALRGLVEFGKAALQLVQGHGPQAVFPHAGRSEEHTSELQSRGHLVCRLLLEKKT